MKKILTLCVIHQHPRVLLGMKKRGFGVGKWNGFGGKVGNDERIEEAAKRELQEEAGIIARDFEECGVVEFEFIGNPEILEVHIFRAQEFLGDPIETEEMKPQWFDSGSLPFESMWVDDRYWMPLLLAGQKFTGKFLFDDSNTIINYTLNEVGDF